MAIPSFSAQLPQESPGLRDYFPLISPPAIYPKEYAVNYALLQTRTLSGIALSFIAMAALYWTCPAVALFTTKHTLAASLGSAVLSFVPGVVEAFRAFAAVSQLAAEEYKKPIPSARATDWIVSSPRTFRGILERKEDLMKVDSRGLSLAAKICSSDLSKAKVYEMLIDSGIDLLTPRVGGKSLFAHAASISGLAKQSLGPIQLEHMLKSKKVVAANISELDQAQIWKQVRNGRVVELLCQYGFNINAKDANGVTPLMHWAQSLHERDSFIIATALNRGANPLLTDQQGRKASELVNEHSLERELLQQAERNFGKQLLLLPKERGLLSWLPWKPPVSKSESNYRADSVTLVNRINGVVAAAIATVYFIPLRAALTVLNVINYVALPLILADTWRAGEEAQRLAVTDYLTNQIPSSQATATISKSPEAARLLLECRPSDLNKLNEEGDSLLSEYGIYPEVFKMLADRGADLLAGGRQSGFFRAIRKDNLDLLAYILDRKLIRIDQVSAELQVQMWMSVGSDQSAHFLQQYGFNPNIQDRLGGTALMYLESSASVDRERVNRLLAVGAARPLPVPAQAAS